MAIIDPAEIARILKAIGGNADTAAAATLLTERYSDRILETIKAFDGSDENFLKQAERIFAEMQGGKGTKVSQEVVDASKALLSNPEFLKGARAAKAIDGFGTAFAELARSGEAMDLDALVAKFPDLPLDDPQVQRTRLIAERLTRMRESAAARAAEGAAGEAARVEDGAVMTAGFKPQPAVGAEAEAAERTIGFKPGTKPAAEPLPQSGVFGPSAPGPLMTGGDARPAVTTTAETGPRPRPVDAGAGPARLDPQGAAGQSGSTGSGATPPPGGRTFGGGDGPPRGPEGRPGDVGRPIRVLNDPGSALAPPNNVFNRLKKRTEGIPVLGSAISGAIDGGRAIAARAIRDEAVVRKYLPFVHLPLTWPINAVRVALNSPKYLWRGINFHYAARVNTHAVFQWFDTMKKTSLVNLIKDLAPDMSNATYVFKNAEGVAEINFAGALESIKDVLERFKRAECSIDEVREAASSLDKNIRALKKDIEIINANPHDPALKYAVDNEGRRLTGGTATARLAVSQGQEHFDKLVEFNNTLSKLTGSRAPNGGEIDTLLSLHGTAENSFYNYFETLAQYTTHEASEGTGIFGGGTGWATRYGTGRIERSLTRAEKAKAKPLFDAANEALVKKLNQEASLTGRSYTAKNLKIDERVLTLNYKPGDDWSTLRMDNGYITDRQKFAEFAYARNRVYEIDPNNMQDFAAAIERANTEIIENIEMMLSRGDNDGVIETLKWLSIRYSTGMGEDANRWMGISEKLIEKMKVAAKDRPNLWTPKVTDQIVRAHEAMVGFGANDARYAWNEVAQYTRNRRFGSDYHNEIKNKKSSNEFSAFQWRYGIGLPGLSTDIKDFSSRFGSKGALYYLLFYPLTKPIQSTFQYLGDEPLSNRLLERFELTKKKPRSERFWLRHWVMLESAAHTTSSSTPTRKKPLNF